MSQRRGFGCLLAGLVAAVSFVFIGCGSYKASLDPARVDALARQILPGAEPFDSFEGKFELELGSKKTVVMGPKVGSPESLVDSDILLEGFSDRVSGLDEIVDSILPVAPSAIDDEVVRSSSRPLRRKTPAVREKLVKREKLMVSVGGKPFPGRKVYGDKNGVDLLHYLVGFKKAQGSAYIWISGRAGRLELASFDKFLQHIDVSQLQPIESGSADMSSPAPVVATPVPVVSVKIPSGFLPVQVLLINDAWSLGIDARVLDQNSAPSNRGDMWKELEESPQIELIHSNIAEYLRAPIQPVKLVYCEVDQVPYLKRKVVRYRRKYWNYVSISQAPGLPGSLLEVQTEAREEVQLEKTFTRYLHSLKLGPWQSVQEGTSSGEKFVQDIVGNAPIGFAPKRFVLQSTDPSNRREIMLLFVKLPPKRYAYGSPMTNLRQLAIDWDLREHRKCNFLTTVSMGNLQILRRTYADRKTNEKKDSCYWCQGLDPVGQVYAFRVRTTAKDDAKFVADYARMLELKPLSLFSQ